MQIFLLLFIKKTIIKEPIFVQILGDARKHRHFIYYQSALNACVLTFGERIIGFQKPLNKYPAKIWYAMNKNKPQMTLPRQKDKIYRLNIGDDNY